MPEDRWSSLLEINLSSEERINDELLERKLLRPNGRIVCVSSMSGVAGNSGQTNYATSKAGVIGMVEALAPELAKRKATINAVAPGFIETQMTAKMPIAIREAGRRMNSMSQGGLPVDVAETIAWFASPASTGVNGNDGPRLRPEPAGGLMSDPHPGELAQHPAALRPRRGADGPGRLLLPFIPGGGKEIPEIELSLPAVRRRPRAGRRLRPRLRLHPARPPAPHLPARARLPAAHGGDGRLAASPSAPSASSTSRTGSSSTAASASMRS